MDNFSRTLYNIRQLIVESSFNLIVAAACFLLIATWVKSFIVLIFEFLFAPGFSLSVKEFSIFGRTYKKENGKFVYLRQNILPTISSIVSVDLEKIRGLSNDELDKKTNSFLTVETISCFAICASLGAALLFASKNLSGTLLIAAASLALGLIFNSITLVIFRLIADYKMKHSLAGYCDSAIKKIRAGVPIKDLDIKKQSELPYKNLMNYELILHFSLYFKYLEESGRANELEEEVIKIVRTLDSSTFTMHHLGAYYDVIYFYSCYKILPSEATRLYSRIREYIEKDKDSNGLRVKSFYELSINNNLTKARELANQAQASLSEFSVGSERDYEKRCVEKLIKILDGMENN